MNYGVPSAYLQALEEILELPPLTYDQLIQSEQESTGLLSNLDNISVKEIPSSYRIDKVGEKAPEIIQTQLESPSE